MELNVAPTEYWEVSDKLISVLEFGMYMYSELLLTEIRGISHSQLSVHSLWSMGMYRHVHELHQLLYGCGGHAGTWSDFNK